MVRSSAGGGGTGSGLVGSGIRIGSGIAGRSGMPGPPPGGVIATPPSGVPGRSPGTEAVPRTQSPAGGTVPVPNGDPGPEG